MLNRFKLLKIALGVLSWILVPTATFALGTSPNSKIILTIAPNFSTVKPGDSIPLKYTFKNTGLAPQSVVLVRELLQKNITIDRMQGTRVIAPGKTVTVKTAQIVPEKSLPGLYTIQITILNTKKKVLDKNSFIFTVAPTPPPEKPAEAPPKIDPKSPHPLLWNNAAIKNIGQPFLTDQNIIWSDTSLLAENTALHSPDPNFDPGHAWIYVLQDKKIVALDSKGDVNFGGKQKVQWSVPGTAVPFRTPAALTLLPINGEPLLELFFAAASDGWLYAINGETGQGRSVITKRPGINCAKDSLVAAPVTQRAAESNAAFKAAYGGEDVVYVITSDGCGDTSQNRIIAYNARDLKMLWAFNDEGREDINAGLNSCAVDYARNQVICATKARDNFQKNLWSINTLDGTENWSAYIDSEKLVSNMSPVILKNRVYFAMVDGYVHTFDAVTGQEMWKFTQGQMWNLHQIVALNSPDTTNTVLLFTDNIGTLYRVDDMGAKGELIWSAPVKASTPPNVISNTDEVYIGSNFNKVYRLDITNGQERFFPSAPFWIETKAPVQGILLDKSASAGPFDRLAVITNSTGVSYYQIPEIKITPPLEISTSTMEITDSVCPGIIAADQCTATRSCGWKIDLNNVLKASCVANFAPNYPRLLSPAMDATSTSPTPQLTWQDQGDSDAVSLLNSPASFRAYAWYVVDQDTGQKVWDHPWGANNDNGEFGCRSNTLNYWTCAYATVPAGLLQFDKTYLWTVKATDGISESDFTATKKFSVKSDFVPVIFRTATPPPPVTPADPPPCQNCEFLPH